MVHVYIQINHRNIEITSERAPGQQPSMGRVEEWQAVACEHQILERKFIETKVKIVCEFVLWKSFTLNLIEFGVFGIM